MIHEDSIIVYTKFWTVPVSVSGYFSSKGSKFSILPVAKLSRTLTLCPRSNSASVRLDPMKPAPPVTKILFIQHILDFEKKYRL